MLFLGHIFSIFYYRAMKFSVQHSCCDQAKIGYHRPAFGDIPKHPAVQQNDVEDEVSGVLGNERTSIAC